MDDESEPEPDIAVAPGGRRDYSREHPSRPVLVVEVAESVLEVYREPTPDPLVAFGWRYASKDVLGPDSSVVPLAAPDRRILVSAQLP